MDAENSFKFDCIKFMLQIVIKVFQILVGPNSWVTPVTSTSLVSHPFLLGWLKLNLTLLLDWLRLT